MKFIGVDPGLRGAIAVIDNDDVQTYPMPTIDGDLDLTELSSLLFSFRSTPHSIYIEKVHAMPGQGVTSMFSFGKGYGCIIGIMHAYMLNYSFVTPQAWQKATHTTTKGSAKERSLLSAIQLFPYANFHITPRSKKAHDGVVDALNIAAYARLKGSK